ncbi:aspartic peptidase domain-containing protein [Chytriomyces sp. MP71]|nr:aspartic peptidase domain-containing protein [Chytriomyces sp. MP71]
MVKLTFLLSACLARIDLVAAADGDNDEDDVKMIPIVVTAGSSRQLNAHMAQFKQPSTMSAYISSFFGSSKDAVNGTSDVALSEYKHVMTEYRAMVSVGTPARTYNLLLDTGSFDMWIYGANCNSMACQRANNIYDVTKSSTGMDLNKTALGGKYADGSGYGGIRVTDNVAIGDAALTGFEFTQVTTYKSQGGTTRFNPSDVDSDGIVGMGFHPQVKTPGITNSFIEQVMTTKVLKKNIFSYFITVMEDGGKATLGGWDASLFQNTSASPSWVQMLTDDSLTDGKLSLPLAKVMVTTNGVTKNVDVFTSHASGSGAPEGNTGSAIIDTGTSQAVVSTALMDAIGQGIPGARKVTSGGTSTYVMDCDTKAEDGGPTVTLEFAGGVQITVTALEYVSAPVNGQCQLMLQSANGGFKQGTYLLGNTFLKRYVTVFDYDQKRIGFALAQGRSLDNSISFNPNAVTVTGSMMRGIRKNTLLISSVLLGLAILGGCVAFAFKRCMQRRRQTSAAEFQTKMVANQAPAIYATQPQYQYPQGYVAYPASAGYPTQPAPVYYSA